MNTDKTLSSNFFFYLLMVFILNVGTQYSCGVTEMNDEASALCACSRDHREGGPLGQQTHHCCGRNAGSSFGQQELWTVGIVEPQQVPYGRWMLPAGAARSGNTIARHWEASGNLAS